MRKKEGAWIIDFQITIPTPVKGATNIGLTVGRSQGAVVDHVIAHGSHG